jgi:hypothetical protein
MQKGFRDTGINAQLSTFKGSLDYDCKAFPKKEDKRMERGSKKRAKHINQSI